MGEFNASLDDRRLKLSPDNFNYRLTVITIERHL